MSVVPFQFQIYLRHEEVQQINWNNSPNNCSMEFNRKYCKQINYQSRKSDDFPLLTFFLPLKLYQLCQILPVIF